MRKNSCLQEWDNLQESYARCRMQNKLFWLRNDTNLIETRFNRKDRRVKLALELLTAKIASLIEIETRKQSSIKLIFKLLIARFILVLDEIWSNALYESDLISSRSNDWLRFRRRDRQSKFVLRSSYRLLICAFTDQCWYLYGDDTNQVSILMM